MEQESRTPDESQIIQQLLRRAYLDTVDDHIRILKEYAESYSRERVEAMEKEKKELKLEIDGCYYAYEDFKLTIASLESKLSTLEELNKELWSLWESMAECGELQIGPQFSAQYKILKEKLKG